MRMYQQLTWRTLHADGKLKAHEQLRAMRGGQVSLMRY